MPPKSQNPEPSINATLKNLKNNQPNIQAVITDTQPNNLEKAINRIKNQNNQLKI